MKVPVVPVKSESGSLFYPTGYVNGTFFSEELKAYKSLGYKIWVLYGYKFNKADLFSKYVNDLYNLKSTSTGARRELFKWFIWVFRAK